MAKLLDQVKNAGMNSGAAVLGKMKRLSELQKHPELESIFAIDQNILDAITESMTLDGYDPAQPIVTGRIGGERYIVDGHTRYEAAIAAGLDEVPVDEKEFENLETAIHYCYRRQAERRNLTQSEIYNAAVKLNIPAKKIAEELGVGISNITRAKKIEREADPEDIAAIKNNKTTINSVYNKIKSSKPKERSEPEDSDEMPEEDGFDDDASEGSGPAETEYGGTAGDAIFESDILDDVIDEEEPEEAAEEFPIDDMDDHDDTCIIKKIIRLLSENGETSAVTLIQNAYPEFFNGGGAA